MKPRFSPRNLTAAAPRDYAVRFLFGGAVSAASAWLGKRYGPEVGGFGTFHHNVFYNTLSRSPEVVTSSRSKLSTGSARVACTISASSLGR